MTKITSDHLARSAYVYVRQSSMDQLLLSEAVETNTSDIDEAYAAMRKAIAVLLQRTS